MNRDVFAKGHGPELLNRFAQTIDLQTARINFAALGSLGVDLSDVSAQTQQFTKINPYPQHQNGLVAISYSREAVKIDQRSGTRERISVTLQPAIVCIDTNAVQAAWKQRIESDQFAPIRFGAGRLSAQDGLHRDQVERNRRGNGPIEMIVDVIEPKQHAHQTAFNFDHQYHACALSVNLTTWHSQS